MKRSKRPTKLDMVTSATEQDYAEQDGGVIRRQRTLLNCQVDVLDAEITDFTKKIVDARRVKATVEAQLLGLGRTIRRRTVA